MKNTDTMHGTNVERITEMAKMTKIEKFYLTNHDFNIFCNKNIQTYGRTLEEELQNIITVEYYRSMQKGGCNAERKDRRTDSRSNG